MRQQFVRACVAAIAAVVASGPVLAASLEKVTAVIPQNSVFVMSWNGGKDAGIFEKHGIDLTVDARPFAAFLSSIPSKQALATTYAGTEAIAKMNQGLDLAIIGGGLTVIQQVYVRKDSPIKSVADLRGKKLGVWSTAAGAFKAVRTAILDSSGIDVVKDTQIVQLAPPALFKLLERGDVDAMINISSFTVQAAAHPDKFRSIFSANDYWKKKTGVPIVWAAPLVAWKSWIKENPTRAKNYAAAVEESFRWLRDPKNFDATVKKYGTLAGIKTPEDAAVYKKWFSENRIFLARWDRKTVDAQWKFLETMKKFGVLDAVPDEKTHALLVEGEGS